MRVSLWVAGDLPEHPRRKLGSLSKRYDRAHFGQTAGALAVPLVEVISMTFTNLANVTARSSVRTLGALGLVLVALSVSGCSRRARVLDVHDHPAVLETGLNASEDATHTAVLKALNERGYVVESDDGRVVTARMQSGDVWAVMRIETGDGHYSISHADSSPEFLYDSERGTVHRRYNRWVKNLAGTIDDTLGESNEAASVTIVKTPTASAGQAKTKAPESADCAAAATAPERGAEPQKAEPTKAEPREAEPSEHAGPEPTAPPEPRTPGAIDI